MEEADKKTLEAEAVVEVDMNTAGEEGEVEERVVESSGGHNSMTN